jgi:putative membrane protein
MMILFWGLLIMGIIAIIRWLFKSTNIEANSSDNSHSALRVLKERFARGEIGLKEFEEKKKLISAIN